MDMIIRPRKLGGIHYLEVFQDDGIQGKPLIVELHGYTGSKE